MTQIWGGISILRMHLYSPVCTFSSCITFPFPNSFRVCFDLLFASCLYSHRSVFPNRLIFTEVISYQSRDFDFIYSFIVPSQLLQCLFLCWNEICLSFEQISLRSSIEFPKFPSNRSPLSQNHVFYQTSLFLLLVSYSLSLHI